MIETSLDKLAAAIESHARAVAELAAAVRMPQRAANAQQFATPAAAAAPGTTAPAAATAPVAKTEKKPSPVVPGKTMTALKAEQAPAVKAEQVETVKAEQAPVRTLEYARALACRILKWQDLSGNDSAMATLMSKVGAKKVSALTPEQLSVFCDNAEAFIAQNKVA